MTERACPVTGELVEEEIDKVATQYREATKFLGTVRAFLAQTEDAAIKLCAVPDFFDIDTAVGDQLTIIGKWLGFPRCHCVCEPPLVIGYGCSGGYTGPYTLAGYCEPGSAFISCSPLGNSTLCIDDDETYRGMLKARRYQMLGLYDIASLQAAARHIWGGIASVIDSKVGRVVIAPGRVLSATEETQVPVAFRVLPIAPGIQGLVHRGAALAAGYGAGWGGYCDGSEIICPTYPHTYTCA